MFLMFRQVKENSSNHLFVKVLFLHSHLVATRLFGFIETFSQLLRIGLNDV
jgi:hypothetical protein